MSKPIEFDALTKELLQDPQVRSAYNVSRMRIQLAEQFRSRFPDKTPEDVAAEAGISLRDARMFTNDICLGPLSFGVVAHVLSTYGLDIRLESDDPGESVR